MKLTLTALFDDETRAQIRESVLGEARGIARSVLDKTVIEEMRRLVDKYITHQYGGLAVKFQEALKTVVTGMVRETFSDPEFADLIRAEVREGVETAALGLTQSFVKTLIHEELRARFFGGGT